MLIHRCFIVNFTNDDYRSPHHPTTVYHRMAEAGIPEVWIVDVNKRQLEVYRQPDEARYRSVQTLTREDLVTATQLPLSVRIRELIG